MTESPDVSIIVPAFNAEQYIGRALTSALTQAGVSLEVIVADDASTDGTIGVVEDIRDERLRLVKLASNSGPGGARNAALDVARGEWIAVLDADDEMDPGRLAKLTDLARNARADIVADNLWVDTCGERSLLIKERLDDQPVAIDSVTYVLDNRPTKPGLGLGFLKPVFSAPFLRRHSLRYDPTLRIGEDFMLVAEMLACGAVYVRQRSAGYLYRKHAGSISHRLGAGAAEAMAAADERFVAEYGPQATPAFRSAMESHLASANDAAAFARFVEAIKLRSWRDATAEAVRRPAILAMLQAPLKARFAKARAVSRPPISLNAP